MININEFSSVESRSVLSKDLEVVDLVAKESLITNFKSPIENLNISTVLKNLIEPKTKKSDFKVLVISDFNKIIKMKILVEDKEIIDFVRDSLTEFDCEIEFDLLGEKSKVKEITVFEEYCQKWCNSIQNYLVNEYGFKGITKIKAAACYGEVEVFDITISGKGTNDRLVNCSKELSNTLTHAKAYVYSNEDEMYEFINNFFKS